ncbi:methyltransferase-like protein 13 [Hordeum vulgare]|nr:methyltransferase-like protein 13 [Hordeum vulgare]
MSLSSPPMSPRGAEEEGDTRSDGTGSGGGAVLSYGEAGYWDAYYVEEGSAPYDWYQRLLIIIGCGSACMSSCLLIIGCGSACMSSPVPLFCSPHDCSA